MNVTNRMKLIRILEKMENCQKHSKKLGLQNKSKFNTFQLLKS